MSSAFLEHKFVQALLLPTFVFAQWWAFEAATVRVGKRWTKITFWTYTSPHHCAKLLCY